MENTPKSGGLTGLSYFAMVSNFFIGGAILEYAVLLFIRRNLAFGRKNNSVENEIKISKYDVNYKVIRLLKCHELNEKNIVIK